MTQQPAVSETMNLEENSLKILVFFFAFWQMAISALIKMK